MKKVETRLGFGVGPSAFAQGPAPSHRVTRRHAHERAGKGFPYHLCHHLWRAANVRYNCEMNSHASGGTKALAPSSPPDMPLATADGVWLPSNVHTLTGNPCWQPSKS